MANPHVRPQQYRLQWPLTPTQVEGLDEMLQTLFKAASTTPSGGGAGTVTAVSVASANGLAGASSGGAAPALTLRTTVTGLLKGNGTTISAAGVGTDYVAPSAYASGNGLTMATSKLLGRTTAGSGAAEEISVAGSLTLSAGVLTGGASGPSTAQVLARVYLGA